MKVPVCARVWVVEKKKQMWERERVLGPQTHVLYCVHFEGRFSRREREKGRSLLTINKYWRERK
jgi:hypothetical protein